jgi:predicted O-methyltransferase YrrM
VRDLVRLFSENSVLQDIIQKTKIWATEEVIFPTLVKLLGYDIVANPCSYDYVKYRKAYLVEDLDRAMERHDVYWIHPVERRLDNPLRRHIRERFNGYDKTGKAAVNGYAFTPIQDFQAEPLIRAIRSIEGWLSDEEARLLVAAAEKALWELPPPHRIVEVGSYHGKSTVLLGKMAKSVSGKAKLYAVDPHDGLQGAADQGLKSYPPSLDCFKQNIQTAGLADVVDIKLVRPHELQWNEPVSFLYIDGLHDYANVSKDFRHFSDWLRPGAYVAFHDYADYFPGVKKLVNELLVSGQYAKADLMQSMIVLRKTNT